MKLLYKEEKKRIGVGRWCMLVVVLFMYLINDSQAVATYIEWGNDTKVLPYSITSLCIWGSIYLVYLNRKLFFIKEQGKTVYLLKKYKIVPIRKKTLYQIRIRIMLEMILLFVAASYGLYLFTAIANHLPTEGLTIVWKMLILMVVLIAVMVIILFASDLYQERKGRKQ